MFMRCLVYYSLLISRLIELERTIQGLQDELDALPDPSELQVSVHNRFMYCIIFIKTMYVHFFCIEVNCP